jgi:hypothetical protein
LKYFWKDKSKGRIKRQDQHWGHHRQNRPRNRRR